MFDARDRDGQLQVKGLSMVCASAICNLHALITEMADGRFV